MKKRGRLIVETWDGCCIDRDGTMSVYARLDELQLAARMKEMVQEIDVQP